MHIFKRNLSYMEIACLFTCISFLINQKKKEGQGKKSNVWGML